MIWCALLLSVAPVPAPPATAPVITQDVPAQTLIDLARTDLDAELWQHAAIRLHAARDRMDDPPAVLAYDEGVAWARAGDLHQAKRAFETAMHDTDSPELAADAAYNLGNVTHQLAQGDTSVADQQAAIDQLTEALSHYRQVIQRNSGDADARANAQLTWERIVALKEQQQEQQDQNQNQEQDQDQQDEDQDQQEQSDEQQQDQQQQDQQQQDQQDEQQDDQQQDRQQSDQPQEQQQDQQQPDQQQQDQPQQPQEPDQQSSPSDSKPMTREEALRLLQRVRDRERERTQKETVHVPGRPATRKDW